MTANGDGFFVGFKLDPVEAELKDLSFPVEIVFPLSIGSYVAFGDPIAEVRTVGSENWRGLVSTVERAIVIERDRSLETDPAFGIEQMTTIAWRSISTSQQNPAPGIAAINNLRDILARWSGGGDDPYGKSSLPIVYHDDVAMKLFGAFESLAVATSESMQHQTLVAILQTIAQTFDRLAPPHQQRAGDIVLRILSILGDHVLTLELDEVLTALESALESAGRFDTSSTLRLAHQQMAATIGKLNSRSTRVPKSD